MFGKFLEKALNSDGLEALWTKLPLRPVTNPSVAGQNDPKP